MPTVLLATDADWLYDDVDASLANPETLVYRVRAGADVLPAIAEVHPDLVIVDSQIGNMGGMAVCMAIRHEEEAERIAITAVMMLLDRAADVFLAQRADADGWLIKPLDSFRLRKAAAILLDGYSYFEGVDADAALATATPTVTS